MIRGRVHRKGGQPLDCKDGVHLKGKSWRELCEAASREYDPDKLLELITALNDVLEQIEEEKAKRNHAVAPEELVTSRAVNMFAA